MLAWQKLVAEQWGEIPAEIMPSPEIQGLRYLLLQAQRQDSVASERINYLFKSARAVHEPVSVRDAARMADSVTKYQLSPGDGVFEVFVHLISGSGWIPYIPEGIFPLQPDCTWRRALW